MDLTSFHVVKAQLPKDFGAAVALLRRPYYPIPKSEYYDLLERLKLAKADFFLWDEQRILVTIGNADGGYAVMPLCASEQSRLLGNLPGCLREISGALCRLSPVQAEELRVRKDKILAMLAENAPVV